MKKLLLISLFFASFAAQVHGIKKTGCPEKIDPVDSKDQGYFTKIKNSLTTAKDNTIEKIKAVGRYIQENPKKSIGLALSFWLLNWVKNYSQTNKNEPGTNYKEYFKWLKQHPEAQTKYITNPAA